jgi:hypothetical protein
VAGCGFRLVATPAADQGPPLSMPSSTDAARDGGVAVDLLAVAAPDLSPAASTGPGALGALPAGFCCDSDQDCRGRNCDVAMLGHKICIEPCLSDADCTHYSDRFFCYPTYHLCSSIDSPFACLPPYELGARPTGACCDPNAAHPGQECAGGWCITSGATGNPYYCSQGCQADADCPANYACDQPSAQCRHVDVVFYCQ